MKVYGPYSRKDGRKHMCVVRDDGTRTTVSYPKYLMEQHLGRKLEDWETVDHINRDKSDDRLENLQILERSEHARLDSKRVHEIEITCIWCGEKALKSHKDTLWSEKQEKAGPFCGKSCIGKYGAEIQNDRIPKLGRVKITPERKYFYLEKNN